MMKLDSRGVAAVAAGAVGGFLLSTVWNRYVVDSSKEMDPDEQAIRREREFLAAQQDRQGLSLTESSSEYFQDVAQYRLLLTKEELDAGAKRCAHAIEQRFKGEKFVICGILKGAFVFMTDLIRHLKRPYSVYFVEASSYSGQKQSKEVDLLSRIVPEKFQGRKIVLVDELLDNGHTMDTMLKHLTKTLNIPKSDIVTCCLFSKVKPDRPAELDAEIAGFPRVPNLWLVGYGLDDSGTKRGWTELFAKPKAEGVPKSDADAIFESSEAGKAAYTKIRAGLLSDLDRARGD